MDEKPIETILKSYQPVFMTLFEHYLEKNQNCLTLTSLSEFCDDFAQSPRLNKTSLADLLTLVFTKETLEDRYEPVVVKKSAYTLLPKKVTPAPLVEKRLVTFFDFQ